MNQGFKHPEFHLSRADDSMVAALIAAASDLTLVVGADDVIKDISHSLDDSLAMAIPAWYGQPLESVVHDNSLPLMRKMLRSARSGKPAQRFDISHPLQGGQQLPVQYRAMRIDSDGRVVLMGRDLRPVADLQSRLLTNRQSLEQNAKRQKQAEAHYRLLFETTSEALVILDPASGRIRDANPRASRQFGVSPADMAGRKFAGLFDKAQQPEVQAFLAGVLAVGTQQRLTVKMPGGGKEILLDADLFRAGDLRLILVRLLDDVGHEGAEAAPETSLGNLVRGAAEAVILTDEDGKILWANESFLAIAQLPLAAQAVGRSLDDFFQWGGLELDVLLANVRRHGRVPLFAGAVRGALGQIAEVDLSAIAMPSGSPARFGLVMRPRAGDEPRSGQGNSDLTRTAENLIEMIGRVPLKDLVRDTTDVIERMCIEAALKLTGNNRASTARVLGLSRQALYLKLHRYGITDEG
ncbi:MAG: transcriptional regulator PpsR [Mesorhizobium sp.]|nr:transcriptional regulator PpsR [Mesorhizobium sp.]